MNKLNICVCGGGNLGHVVSALLADAGHKVSILTGRPEQWHKRITLEEEEKNDIVSTITEVSDDPYKVIPNADIIIFALAGMQNELYLKRIAKIIKKGAVVGTIFGSTGFYWMAKYILDQSIDIFTFQRVPFISRIREYGKSAVLKGRKNKLYIYTSDKSNWILTFFENIFDTKIELLKSPLTAILTNSNPLLHPSRLMTLFGNDTQKIYSKKKLLYEEWDNEASKLYIETDNEFQTILEALNISKIEIPDVLSYYESHDSESLTRKIQSITSFKDIYAPMCRFDSGYILDTSSRFFSEDIPFGTLLIKSIASLVDVQTPNIDKLIYWGQGLMNKEYLINGELIGRDIIESGIPNNYGIDSIEKLLNLK